MTTVAVLVPCHNAEGSIERTLRSVLAQTRPADQILVALDNCSDGSEAIVRDLGVDYIIVSGGSKAKAQNAALPHIWTDLVLPLDDDTTLAPDYLELVCPKFDDDPLLSVASGSVLTQRQDSWTARARQVEYLSAWSGLRVIQQAHHSAVFASGCCTVFRREYLGAGFPESTLTEDLTYGMQQHAAGRHVEYVRDAVAYADEPETLAFMRTQLKRWKSGAGQTFRQEWWGAAKARPLVGLWTAIQMVEIGIIMPVMLAMLVLVPSWDLAVAMLSSEAMLVWLPTAVSCRKWGLNFFRVLTWWPCWLGLRILNAEADFRHFLPELLGLRKPFMQYEIGHATTTA